MTNLLTLNDAYRILEVTATANNDEIKSAYKRLALKSHPDKNPHDPYAHQKFLKISEAYKQLCESSTYIESDEEDHDENDEQDHDFAFKMFEKMFFGKHGNKIKGRKISGGFMFSSRHECDCPHCRCYSKPKSPYIPKSQRPKDPNTSTATTTTTTTTTTTETPVSTVDDWLEDIEDKKSSKKQNKISTKKKSVSKKKVSRERSYSDTNDTEDVTKSTGISGFSPSTYVQVVDTSLKPDFNQQKENDLKIPETLIPEDYSQSDSDEDDVITAEDMASTLGIGKQQPTRRENVKSQNTEIKSSKSDKILKSKNPPETVPTPTPKNPPKESPEVYEKSQQTVSSTNMNKEKETKQPEYKGGKKNTVVPESKSISKPKRPLSDTTKSSDRPAPTPPKDNPSDYVHSKQLKVLLEMGFSEKSSKNALDKSSGNIDAATSLLLQQTSESKQSSEQPAVNVKLPSEICLPCTEQTSAPTLGPIDEPHLDADLDDLLLVPSSYESFTTQLQQQMELEAKSSISMAWCGNNSLRDNLGSRLLPEPALQSLLASDNQLGSESFPSLGQIFTHEPPTLQLFPQVPQLFQADLFLGSSPSASSSVSSISLVSGDTIDDHPITLPENLNSHNNTSIIQPSLPSTNTTTTTTTTTTTISSSSPSSSSLSSSTTISNSTPCMYFNTPRGCRNASNCKFLHIEIEKNKDSGSLITRNRPMTSNSSRNQHVQQARVCAFYPTPAGCKLGNSCKFLHQR